MPPVQTQVAFPPQLNCANGQSVTTTNARRGMAASPKVLRVSPLYLCTSTRSLFILSPPRHLRLFGYDRAWARSWKVQCNMALALCCRYGCPRADPGSDMLNASPPAAPMCADGLVWNDCGSACNKTCAEPSVVCIELCVPRCECSGEMPIWHPDVGACGTTADCKDDNNSRFSLPPASPGLGASLNKELVSCPKNAPTNGSSCVNYTAMAEPCHYEPHCCSGAQTCTNLTRATCNESIWQLLTTPVLCDQSRAPPPPPPPLPPPLPPGNSIEPVAVLAASLGTGFLLSALAACATLQVFGKGAASPTAGSTKPLLALASTSVGPPKTT